MAEPSVGRDTARYITQLRDSAAMFGNLFVLDPLPPEAGGGTNGSLGLLELNPNVAGLLLGSTLEPQDTKTPDGQQILKGLNSYAGLIAGPGKYIFEHGTRGGGFIIRPERPTDAE